MTNGEEQNRSGRSVWHAAIAVVMLVGASAWCFTNLGHYPLWEDEADTALFALGVWQTGDTSAVLGHNLYAFRNGRQLEGFKNRMSPPGTYYLTAPFVGIWGRNAFAARFPYALCGVLTIALLAWWLWRDRADTLTWMLMAIGLLSNVSFFLFARQCRYYALATLLAAAIAYLVLHFNGSKWALLAIAFLSACLFATQYLVFVAVYAVLGVDYLVWGRKRYALSAGQWALLLTPQIIVELAVLFVWNPLGKDVVENVPPSNRGLDRITLFLWNLRDLNACEFGVGILLLAALALWFSNRDPWLLRGVAAVIVYCAAVSVLSPQHVTVTSEADVRYLVPLIPVCVFVGAQVLVALTRRIWWLAVPLAILVFGTNVLNVPWAPLEWRSTTFAFAGEIVEKRQTAVGAAIDWIDQNVGPGRSIWVLPFSKAYPLMFHRPRPQYAWQLHQPGPEFNVLPAIHFVGREPVDYAIAFGPDRKMVEQILYSSTDPNAQYALSEVLDVYYDDKIRPELLWHSFNKTEGFSRNQSAVYIYRRVRR